MELSHRVDYKTIVSCWDVFRLIFVSFFLYLLADVFFRWDGFRYFASFSEFLPSVALISILWFIVAALTALLAWILIRLIESISSALGKKVKAEHQLIFGFLLILILTLAWYGRGILFGPGSTVQKKIIILSFVTIAAIFLTWVVRNKYRVIQEMLTPLVILFGIVVVVSVPIVTYHTLIKKPWISESAQTLQRADRDTSLSNILLVTFDAMTTLDMSVYGYYRNTTPFITNWSKTATVFNRAYSASTTTQTTTATLMTGKRLWTHLRFSQVHGNIVAKSKVENLALELKKHGYYTMAVAANANASVRALGIAKSFDYNTPWTELHASVSVAEYIKKWLYDIFGEKILLYEWLVMEDFALYKILSVIPLSESERPFPTEITIARFLKAIDNKAPEPLFAWIHFHPPHTPYTPPKPFKKIFNDSSIMIKNKDQAGMDIGDKLNKLEDMARKRKLLKILRDRYDENMLYCDKTFEDLIGQLKKRGLFKNTTIILSSDHGESFEHDYWGHGANLYEADTHIPLIIKEHNQTKKQVIDMPVGQEDIAATILGFADIPIPSWMEGRSLVPLLHGEELAPRPVFSMNLVHNMRGQMINKGDVSIWDGDYKLILRIDDNSTLLFNVKHDPGEFHDLSYIKPKVKEHLQNLILDSLRKANKKIEMFKPDI